MFLRGKVSFVSIRSVGLHKQALTLSIVIPAYNEERHLVDCLEAIARQTVAPDEVIVVNNNSIDRTAEIARNYPFVTVVNEAKQGMIFARDKGFKVAKGDILGRIDADARISENWVEEVKRVLSNPMVAAVSGPGITYTLPPSISEYRSTLWSRVYIFDVHGLFRVPVLWGSNMAIRKSAWKTIEKQTSKDEKIVHEDQDISFLLAGNGLLAKFDPRLTIFTDGDTYFYWPKFREYFLRSIKTRNLHRRNGTLNSPDAIRLSWLRTVLAVAVGTLPLLIFTMVSYLYILSEAMRNSFRLLKAASESEL